MEKQCITLQVSSNYPIHFISGKHFVLFCERVPRKTAVFFPGQKYVCIIVKRK